MELDYDCVLHETQSIWQHIRIMKSREHGAVLYLDGDLSEFLGYFNVSTLLRSAVGKTRVLQSGLVMDYTTSYFPLIVFGYPLDSKRPYGP